MIDHLGVQAADVEASARFYTTVFAPIGFTEGARFPSENGPVVGLADASGNLGFWLSPRTSDGAPSENHVAFAAGSREDVDAVHAAAVKAGVEVLHEPREWPEYHPGYYGLPPRSGRAQRGGRRTPLSAGAQGTTR